MKEKAYQILISKVCVKLIFFHIEAIINHILFNPTRSQGPFDSSFRFRDIATGSRSPEIPLKSPWKSDCFDKCLGNIGYFIYWFVITYIPFSCFKLNSNNGTFCKCSVLRGKWNHSLFTIFTIVIVILIWNCTEFRFWNVFTKGDHKGHQGTVGLSRIFLRNVSRIQFKPRKSENRLRF